MSKMLPVVKTSSNLPVISDDYSLARYIEYIKKYPILTATEEYEYATAWTSKQDLAAAEKLITSHLRMVVTVAYEFKIMAYRYLT